MQVLRKTYRLLTLATGLFLLSACSSEEVWEDLKKMEASQYINLTLYVSDSESVTRSPQGGEDGDGREAGFFDRENRVTGITLILYKGSGPNDATAKVDFVKYYTVTEEGHDPQLTPYNYNASSTFRSEARYTTGDRPIETGELDFTATYHALVIANKNLTSSCTVGTTKISEVLSMQTDAVLTNTTPTTPWTAENFVITTERDATIDFTTIPQTVKKAENKIVYNVMEPLLIERLSARIDFCTKGATYDDSKKGYKYNVGSSTDIFVVTRITPFNLYNENEYLFKRVQDTWTGTPVTTYLGDETLTNYVVDPNTEDKDNANTFSYLSPLVDFKATPSDYGLYMDGDVLTKSTFTDANGNNNVIIAYPRENTLMPTSHLKKYATGIAIEGNYYVEGVGTPMKYVFYTYLRHQGEELLGNYDAVQWKDLSDTQTCKDGVAMNFGVVRNNIYQVSINSVSTKDLGLEIKVKKWDPYLHDYIYM